MCSRSKKNNRFRLNKWKWSSSFKLYCKCIWTYFKCFFGSLFFCLLFKNWMHVTSRELISCMVYQAITLWKRTGGVSSVSYSKITSLKLDLPGSFQMSEFREEGCQWGELSALLYHRRAGFQSIKRQHKEKYWGDCIADKTRTWGFFVLLG